jgi:glycosyltransferase involved in cell wall biosynthesis
MAKSKKIIFWQSIPSFHMSAAIRRLSKIWPDEVIGVYDIEIPPIRKIQGWKIPDMGATQVHLLENEPDPKRFASELIADTVGDIHILSGTSLAYDLASPRLIASGASHLGMMGERPNQIGWRSLPKLVRYRNQYKKFGRHAKLFLAMGQLGVQSYCQLGYSPEIVFPFCYQLDSLPEIDETAQTDPTNEVRFVYVGQGGRRKGVDLLLRATERLSRTGWRMDFVGIDEPGLDKNYRCKINRDRLHGLGNQPADTVYEHLRQADVALVPSRFDGWGMVTGEAIACGIGPIVTDQTGSRDLVDSSGSGMVVKAGKVAPLASAMQAVIDRPKLATEWKQKARVYRPNLSGENVGDYLADLLRYIFLENRSGQPPIAAWLAPS